jgi:predicted dienelactone hydrolase
MVKSTVEALMRFFEIIILGSIAFLLIGIPFSAMKRIEVKIGFLLLILISVVLHILLEKTRWQMTLAYVLLGILIIVLLTEHYFQSSGTFTRWMAGIGLFVGWLLFAIEMILLVALPVFKFPNPSGPHQIGVRDFYFVDESRAEDLSPDPNARRELMVRVWYPAQPESGSQTQSFWPDADRTGPPILKRYGFPSFVLNHLALVKTHSYLKAPLVDQSKAYPVLVFSHGYGQSDFSMNLTQMEELASHGYIVFSINHTYESWATVFPDGRVIPESEIAFNTLHGSSGEMFDLDARLSTWVADTQFVLDQLERINKDMSDPFAGKLDLERLGVFGMSFGGATATEICLMDSRCKAGANMDGSQFGYVDFSANHLQIPFMFFYSENSNGMNDYIYEGVENRAYRVVVQGSSHTNYTDAPLWSPFSKYASSLVRYPIGTIDQRRMTSITNAYLLAFFDRHLKNQQSTLLDETKSPYGEVDYRFR